MSEAMSGSTVRVWLLRFVLVVGATGALIVMHSLPITSHDRMGLASHPPAVHVAAMTTDPMGNDPSPPGSEDHGLEHLCLAVLAAVTVSIGLTLVRRLWRATSATAGGTGPVPKDRNRAPRSPPSLSRLCILRL